jgi:hypothetical protein
MRLQFGFLLRIFPSRASVGGLLSTRTRKLFLGFAAEALLPLDFRQMFNRQ